jgi:23S rRNA (uracil1939-C5)-methyltransferase
MNDTFNVRIDRLVYGGDGIGRMADGRAVFVPFTTPGELVRVRVIEEKGRYARAKLVEVIESSPQRIDARCCHFTECGGCHYQHLNYPYQVSLKADILKEQLERIGGLIDIPGIETITSPNPWNYRNHVQFHITREGKLGFQKAQTNQTFPIRECHLPEASINQLWPRIDIESIPELERICVRTGWNEELMLVLENSNPQKLDITVENLGTSVVEKVPSGNLVLAGSDHITMEVLGERFQVSSTSFFQVNTYQANTMVKHIMDNLPLVETMTVVDVYCGVGLFSAFLAPKVKKLVGIELSPEACEDFTVNLDEFENVDLYEATAEAVLTQVSFDPDVIVVDPPREGLERKTMDGILSQGASQLIYFSCDPATMARDAKRLTSAGYRLEKIAMIDMFPQTYHIESASYWEKN